jgi:hypothetical protein
VPLACHAESWDAPLLDARHPVEGHPVFVSARSLRSIESSPVRTSPEKSAHATHRHAGDGGGGGAEAEQPDAGPGAKCQLLQALLASVPLAVPANAGALEGSWEGAPRTTAQRSAAAGSHGRSSSWPSSWPPA